MTPSSPKPGRAPRAVLTVIGIAGAAALVLAVVRATRTPEARKQPYVYDLNALRKVDPKFILYRLAGTIHTPYQDARAIALGPDGRIYLAADKAIRILPAQAAAAGFDPTKVRTIPTARTPRCLAVSEAAEVYAGVGGALEVYSPTGKLLRQWVIPAEAHSPVLTSIVLSGRNVFVADAGNRVVLRYDTAGKLLGRLGRKDKSRGVPGLVVPSPYLDLAVGPDGLLRVVNPGRLRVEAYTFDGELELWWGRASPRDISAFAGCCNPAALAIDPRGRFVTAEKGIRRVKLYDGEGKFLGVVAPPDAFAADRPPGRKVGELDLAVARDGRVFVLDPYTGEVKVFAAKPEGDR